MRNRYKVINCAVQSLEAELNEASGDGWKIKENIDYYFTGFGQRWATAVMARQEGEN